MSKAVIFNEDEVSEATDFSNIGAFARQDAQAIIGGAIAYPHHWSRFTISQPSAVTLRINPGTLFVDDRAYTSGEAIDLNLQQWLPLVTGDRKWIALLVRGFEETVHDNRLIETDVDTGETVLQAVPKTSALRIQIVVQDGLPSPGPIKPSVPGDQCCLAFVELSTIGIGTIEPGETWRLKTLYEIEGRVTQLEGDMTDIRQRTAQLETDVAFITNQLRLIPRPEIVEEMKRDIAAMRRDAAVPDETRSYWYDPCLIKKDWDDQHPSWLARIREGGRHAYAQIVDSQLSLLNPADPKLRITDKMVLPKWQEVTRIAVEGNDGSEDISQVVHTEIEAIQNTISRSSISYGPSVSVCENNKEWINIGKVHPGETFNVNGVEYVSAGLSKETSIQYMHEDRIVDAAAWNADPQSEGHKSYTVQQVIRESWTETYWTYITHKFGLNGAIFGQTLLNSQQMIMTSIDLYFTRVGSTGDVHLLFCEVDSGGRPQFKNVIASTTLTKSQLKTGWVRFPFTPTLLTAGRRYAWFTVTVGNHALAYVRDNKFAQGSKFVCTDGAWAQGSTTEDFAFRINAAQFDSPLTVVEFSPLTCPLGMTEIQLLYSGWEAPGTALNWEIKPVGTDKWLPLNPSPTLDQSPLYGQPALAQLRCSFIGTTDLQPALLLDSTARSAAMRMRSDMTAISKVRSWSFNTTQIVTQTVVDSFYPDNNTFQNKVMIGTTEYSPDATTVTVDRDKPSRRTYRSVFTVPSTNNARYIGKSTTDNVCLQPFIQNAAMYAI